MSGLGERLLGWDRHWGLVMRLFQRSEGNERQDGRNPKERVCV